MAGPQVLRGVSVLLVDDNEDSLEVERMILTHEGANVVATRTADSALERLDDFHPDVVVSDLAMAEMDGFAFCERLHEPESPCRSVPCVAVSGFACESDRKRAREAGFAMHVPKPVEPEHLVAVVAALAARARAMDDNTDEPTLPRTLRCFARR